MKVEIYGYVIPVNNMQIRQNFSLTELANVSGDATLPMFVIDERSDKFLDMLQSLRSWYSKPMKITSNFRQKKFNDKVGGDPKSAHLHGCAADWWIPGHTEQQRQNVINKWKELCATNKVIGAINLYTNGYHIEIYSDKWYGQKQFAVRDYRGIKGKDW